MTQNYVRPVSGESFNVVTTKVINGVEDAATHFAGTTDPSSGGTWGASRVGSTWDDTTNRLDGAGDDLGSTWKRFESTTATPTYGWRTLNLRNYAATSPNTAILTISASSKRAWTDLDVSGATTSIRALSINLFVEVQESNPGGGVFFALRKNGVTTDANERRIYPQVSSVTAGGMYTVELDANQIFEYRMVPSGNTSANVELALCGYTERV